MSDQDRSGYGGEDRRTWKGEASALNARLEAIEALARATHDCVIGHVESEKETREAIGELILLWRGSKMMVSAFKILIPIAAALVGVAVWVKDHFKW